MTGDGKGHRPVDPRARSKKQSWKEAARERQQFWLMPISFEELQRRLEAGENVAGATAPMGTDGTWGRAHLWISLPGQPARGKRTFWVASEDAKHFVEELRSRELQAFAVRRHPEHLKLRGADWAWKATGQSWGERRASRNSG